MDQEKQVILSRFDDYGKELKREHEAQVERLRKDYQAKVKTLQDRDAQAREEIDSERLEIESIRNTLE